MRARVRAGWRELCALRVCRAHACGCDLRLVEPPHRFPNPRFESGECVAEADGGPGRLRSIGSERGSIGR
eukprot:6177363-Pleurochrysis_carterae.AAC.2